MEYVKIVDDILYIKNEIFKKEKQLMIKDIKKIIIKNSITFENFVYDIILENNKNYEIRTNIENKKEFFNKLLMTNNTIESEINGSFAFTILDNIFSKLIALFFFTISFYTIIKGII
jgi:hypothetical protein